MLLIVVLSEDEWGVTRPKAVGVPIGQPRTLYFTQMIVTKRLTAIQPAILRINLPRSDVDFSPRTELAALLNS